MLSTTDDLTELNIVTPVGFQNRAFGFLDSSSRIGEAKVERVGQYGSSSRKVMPCEMPVFTVHRQLPCI